MRRERALSEQDMGFIARLLLREKERYTETRGERLFDLGHFSDETMHKIDVYLNVCDGYASNDVATFSDSDTECIRYVAGRRYCPKRSPRM